MDVGHHDRELGEVAEPRAAEKPAKEAASPTGALARDGRRVPPTAARMIALQRTAGNRAASAALRAGRTIQRVAADTTEQLAFAPKEVAEEAPAETTDQAPASVGGAAAAAAAGVGAAAGAGASSGESGGPPAGAGGGAGGAAGEAASGVAGAVAKIAGAQKVGGVASQVADATKAAGAEKVGGVASKVAEATKAAGAEKVAGVASKAAGAEKVAGVASKVAEAAKVADAAKKAAGAEKAAGVATKVAEAVKKEAAAKKAAGFVEKVATAKKASAPQPLPAAAKKAPAVKSAPAPASPNSRPAKIDTATKAQDFLKVAAPPVPAPGGQQGAAMAESAASVALQSLPLQRDGGAPAGGGWNGDMSAPVWDTWTMDDLFSGARTALEVSRFVPGWGLLGGGVADVMGAVQDLESIPPGDYPITNGLVWLRSIVNVMNNATGHLMYVGELIQDGLAGSVIGAEFVPVSAAAMESAAGVKVVLDGVLLYADLGVEIGALWNQSHSGEGQWEQWQGVIDGYQANLMGDIVGTILDTITLGSAGATNVDVLKAGSGIFNTAGILAQNWGRTLVTFVQGMFNVWGSKAPLVGGEQVPIGTRPPAPAPAPAQRLAGDVGSMAEATAMRGAAGWLGAQATQGRAAWRLVDAGIGVLEEEGARRMAELDAVVVQISGGRNLWQVLQEGTLAGLAHMREKMTTLEQMAEAASNAEENGQQLQAWTQDLLTKIDAFTVPNVTIPAADIGDGLLADAAEWAADQAAAVANAALEALVAQVREAVENVKDEIKVPVQAVQDKAVEIGEFLALVARVSGQQVSTINGYIANFEQGLARCNGFEDAVNLIISQITGLMGGQPFTIQDIRDFWHSLPEYFDQIDGLSRRLIVAADRLENPAAVQTLPVTMAPPIDPDDERH